MYKTYDFKLIPLFVAASLTLSACSISSNQSGDNTIGDQVTYDHLTTAQDQVDLFDLQVSRLQVQLELGEVSAQTLSIQGDWSDSLRDVPADAAAQWEQVLTAIFKALPDLQTAEFTWLAEASQLVASNEVNTVTDDLVGFFVISAHFEEGLEEGFSDWAVMLTVNLDTWEILSWKVNENIRPDNWEYIPGEILCNRGEGCTHFRRVLPEGLNPQSLGVNTFPVAIAEEDKGFKLYSE